MRFDAQGNKFFSQGIWMSRDLSFKGSDSHGIKKIFPRDFGCQEIWFPRDLIPMGKKCSRGIWIPGGLIPKGSDSHGNKIFANWIPRDLTQKGCNSHVFGSQGIQFPRDLISMGIKNDSHGILYLRGFVLKGCDSCGNKQKYSQRIWFGIQFHGNQNPRGFESQET